MPNTKPNIILITTDQQRYDSVRMHGSPFMNTPNMDRLGNEGVSFRRAYCPNTVCTPARVSIMTGLHLSRHGSYNIGTRAGGYDLFLSTILKAHGYRTHHIGKAHWNPFLEGKRVHPVGKATIDPPGATSPETAEVDEAGTPFFDYAGFETAELCVGHTTYGITGHYEHWLKRQGCDPSCLQVNPLFDHDPYETGDWNLPSALHSGHWLAERAAEFLRQHDGRQPFFLNLGFQDPHHPHVLPADFHNRVRDADVPLPDIRAWSRSDETENIRLLREGGIVDSRFNGRFAIAGNVNDAWRPYFEDESKARATRAYYYSLVQLIDEQLGRILAALDEREWRDDTIVVFTSDHGEMLGDHAIGQKGPLAYEGVARVPLLIRYPSGFQPCHVDDEVVSLVDLLPTLLDFAGIDVSEPRDGVSLKRLLVAGDSLDRQGVRIEFKEEADRIRFKCWVTRDWKLVVYPGETFGELYDLKHDPTENRNLFSIPEYQAKKAQLLTEMICDMERSEPLNERMSRA